MAKGNLSSPRTKAPDLPHDEKIDKSIYLAKCSDVRLIAKSKVSLPARTISLVSMRSNLQSVNRQHVCECGGQSFNTCLKAISACYSYSSRISEERPKQLEGFLGRK